MEKYRGIDIANYFLKHSYDLSSYLTQKLDNLSQEEISNL